MTDFEYNDYETFYNEENDDEKKAAEYYSLKKLQRNRLERKVRQSNLWLARIRFLLKYILIFGIIFFGYKSLRMPEWYLDKNIFNSVNTPNLEILNNKIVPSSKILAALRRTKLPHTPIYKLETTEIRDNIMKIEPIKKVFIRRFWFPARLQIIVEERTPILTISPSIDVAPIAFFANGGKLIGRDYLPLDKSFKTVLVLTYGTKGDDYRNWDNKKVKHLEKIAKAIKANAHEDIEYIDYRDPKDVYVKVKTANIRLGKIDSTVFKRIKRISSILPQVKTLDKEIKYIDLRWENANYIKLG